MSEIGFKKTIVEQVSPLVPINFTNALCYGVTGSGKTSGFILPNIEHRIKANHALLVYDFKGNLHTAVKFIATKHNKLEDIIEVGKLYGSNINILKNININSLSKIHKLIQGEHKDSYWSTASFALFSDLYFLLIYLLELYEVILNTYEIKKDKSILTIDMFLSHIIELDIYEVSIQTLFKYLKDSETLTSFLTSMKNTIDNYLISILNDNEELFIDCEKVYVVYDSFKQRLNNLEGYSNLKNHSDETGRYAVISTLSSTLSSISSLDFLNKDSLDIIKALNSSKIVIINVANLSDNVIAALNVSIYENLTRRVSYSDTTPITIVADEAHRILNQEYTPDTDLCRENMFEYLFTTQSQMQLESALGSFKMELMKRNIVSTYSFRTTDESLIQTTDLKEFEYIDFSNNKRCKAKPIFISEDDLNRVEMQYQRDIDVYEPITLKRKENTLLVHNPSLYLEKKLYVKDIKTNKLIIEDYICKEDLKNIKNRIQQEARYNFNHDEEKNNNNDQIKTLHQKQNILYESVQEIESKLNRFLEAKKDLLTEEEYLEYLSDQSLEE